MTSCPTTTLTTLETEILTRAEAKIRTGLATFVEVGEALLVVRDQRLYRGEFKTFEDYCRTRWNISRPEAYRRIAEAQTVHDLRQYERSMGNETLSPIGDKNTTPSQASTSETTLVKSPETRSHLRALFPLSPEEKALALNRAREIARAKEENLKNDHIQQAVHETKGIAGGNWNLGQGLPNPVIAKPKESNSRGDYWERVAAKERAILSANDSEDSTPLGELKRYWVRATKKDRKAFLKWAKV